MLAAIPGNDFYSPLQLLDYGNTMANWLEGKVVENRRLNDYLTSLIIAVELGGYEAGQTQQLSWNIERAQSCQGQDRTGLAPGPAAEVQVVETGARDRV